MPLDGVNGLDYKIDEATQELLINASPGLLSSIVIDSDTPEFSRLTPASTGGFFNYDP
ncbi:MAG TPA: hypothetical protein VHK27_05275 [Gammaproteobacteria bacterium]|nr:hypothetical protein [Gammaproteobacteria bacterium]